MTKLSASCAGRRSRVLDGMPGHAVAACHSLHDENCLSKYACQSLCVRACLISLPLKASKYGGGTLLQNAWHLLLVSACAGPAAGQSRYMYVSMYMCMYVYVHVYMYCIHLAMAAGSKHEWLLE